VTADSHVTIVRPDIDKIDPLYLGFAVYNKQSIIEAMGEGATGQTELSRDRLGDLDIEYPDDKNEQQKIASILSAYDDLIEVNNKRIKILEEMAQLIYKEWFVNFKFPGYEKVKIKNGLPEGWEVKKIGEIVDSIKQKYIDEKNEGLPLLDLGRIPRKSLSISEYGLSNEIKTARKIFDEDDILFGNIRVYFHKVIFGMKKGITNSSVFVLRAKNKKYQNFFLNYFFSEDIISWASQNSGGTKMPVIGWEVLKKKKIILPEEGIIKEYNNRTNWMLVLIKNLNLQNENLRKTRDLLLPKLMSGEIEV
jgi:type I restriction enzyme S subunit